MSHPWRHHRRLAGRFHEEDPDDLQVLVHDGGPRLTDRRPELVWARVVDGQSDVFEAVVLNEPVQLTTVRQGDRIRFVVPASGEHPVMVTPKYLRERSDWVIAPCSKCGFSELLDAPSDLIAKVFPSTQPGDVIEAFTARCGVCGGAQIVQVAGLEWDDADQAPAPSAPRKWWEFWKRSDATSRAS